VRAASKVLGLLLAALAVSMARMGLAGWWAA
jgi:small neutral amino acid transporter SnatA (MarC family)